MLQLPSVQGEYADYWSGDPAFHQPDSNDEESVREHADKVRRARETGDWSPLLIEGQVPTKFVMKPLKGRQLRWLIDQSSRNDEYRIGNAQLGALVFRCAFVSAKDLDLSVADRHIKHPELGKIASADVTDVLDRIDQSIVIEIAAHVYEKALNLNPL